MLAVLPTVDIFIFIFCYHHMPFIQISSICFVFEILECAFPAIFLFLGTEGKNKG